MMMIVSIGEWTAGTVGAIVVLLAFFGPTAVLALLVGRLWKKLEKWPWRASIQKGLAPVSIGLLLAGCYAIAKGAITGATTAAIAFVVFMTLLRFKLNPAFLILGGAVVGLFAFGIK
jgi:chromate transporter